MEIKNNNKEHHTKKYSGRASGPLINSFRKTETKLLKNLLEELHSLIIIITQPF